jgi:hypothetical protein
MYICDISALLLHASASFVWWALCLYNVSYPMVMTGSDIQVTDVEILPDGVIRVQVAEAEVHNINIRFLDRKTGEPTVGKTHPETLLRQLTTKIGQVSISVHPDQ